ncbi:helix-turn-helix transcriptional regulator [Actinoallomurus sp. NPDC050550]|uniref:helix-turn-helix domain-containing protein n=1 Tax=Actinoallomurus sp. NPDC050550 TaxID=3154937 RepID=UPI0033F2745C
MGNPPSPALIKLSAAIRRHRKRAGQTQAALAKEIPCSDKTISAIETGRERPSREMVIAIEKALNVSDGALVDLFDLLEHESLPRWVRDWLVEERRASRLRSYEQAIVPGLLQTEDYARVLLNGNEVAVQTRIERQAILSADPPPKLHFVIDEAVLYRDKGGSKVMHDQLMRLVECVSEQTTVQVVPSDASPRLSGAFTIGTIDGSEVAYVDTAVRGIVTSSHEDIATLEDVWETIRSHALSLRESLNYIRRTAEEKWI